MWACSEDAPVPAPIPTPDPTEAYLSVESITPENIGEAGGEITITIKSSRVATANPAETWVTRKSSGREGDISTFIFTIAPNDGAERSSSITFTAGQLKTDATIKQAARKVPDNVEPPVIPNADSSVEYAALLGLGWNLGNQFDAHNNGTASETAWGNPATTQQLFYKLAEAGIKSVRIPVTWLGKFGSAPGYTIEAAWLDRVDEVVGYVVANGMYAILNIHWDGGWLENTCKDGWDANVDKKQRDYWTQIATRLNHYDEHLLLAARESARRLPRPLLEPGEQGIDPLQVMV